MILRKPVKQATPELIAAKLLYKAVLCKQEVSVLKPKKQQDVLWAFYSVIIWYIKCSRVHVGQFTQLSARLKSFYKSSVKPSAIVCCNIVIQAYKQTCFLRLFTITSRHSSAIVMSPTIKTDIYLYINKDFISCVVKMDGLMLSKILGNKSTFVLHWKISSCR